MSAAIKSCASMALVVCASAFVACAVENEPKEPTESPIVSLSRTEALEELNGLFARSVDRELAKLPASERAETENRLAEHGMDLHALAFRQTAAGTPRDLIMPGFRIRATDLGLPGRAPAARLADTL